LGISAGLAAKAIFEDFRSSEIKGGFLSALFVGVSDDVGGYECARVGLNPWWSKACLCGDADVAVDYSKRNLTCIFNAANNQGHFAGLH
jgi:hypothetical protein